jgi:hypothetical protein
MSTQCADWSQDYEEQELVETTNLLRLFRIRTLTEEFITHLNVNLAL